MVEKEVKIPIEEAALYVKKFVVPIVSFYAIPYVLFNLGLKVIETKVYLFFYDLYKAVQSHGDIFNVLFSPVTFFFNSFDHFGLLILLLLPAIVLHELLHAVAAIVFSKGNFKAISFGFDKKTLSPYTHCKLPLYVWQYQIVLALPGIVLGLVPGILGIVLKSPELVVFGIVFTFGALGDYLMLTILKNYSAKTKIKDHPSTLGFFIVE